MKNPYEILGVSPDASNEEVNTAYRKLVKQYHPDRYVGNPLSDLAKEKMVEINTAYDEIMNERKSGGNKSGYKADNTQSDYNRIRVLINQNHLSEAERELNNINIRDAQWHFLMGCILERKGWYDMAYQHYDRAVYMEPSNPEYRNAKDKMDYSGAVYRGMGDAGGYEGNACNLCQTLICADCCCEMCGGNLIPCLGCR